MQFFHTKKEDHGEDKKTGAGQLSKYLSASRFAASGRSYRPLGTGIRRFWFSVFALILLLLAILGAISELRFL